MVQKKNNYLKSIIRFLIQIGVVAALLMGFSIFHGGMYLIGVPKAEKVQYVTVSYPEVTDGEKKITDWEQIRLAVQLTGFLRYSLLEEADRGESPMITITYYRENQPAITVSANRNTVWWKGIPCDPGSGYVCKSGGGNFFSGRPAGIMREINEALWRMRFI